MEAYQNKHLPIEERVSDLLSKMTLKEKVGQLNQKMYGWNAYKKINDGYELTEDFKKHIEFGDGMGALYGLFRADPWSRVNFENGILAKDSAKVANLVQKYVIENTRLGIPILLSEECPHGHQALESVMYPTNLGRGATWNAELQEKVSENMAEEMRQKGVHLSLVSTLDILRDPRWGRSEECFSEDPFLASAMTKAVVEGFQGKASDKIADDKMVTILKHFCAQGQPVGGHNSGPVLVGEREVREIFLPAMKAGAESGALGVMAAYNEIDGIPCHGDKKLLTGILREELGFKGIVMADGCALDRLVKLTGDEELAAEMALDAGVDLSLWDDIYTQIEKGVKNGKIDEKLVDRAVARMLTLKFKLGLFEQPYIEEKVEFNKEKWQEDNLQVARESLVMLKNDGVLPLSNDVKKIAVIGPNGDSLYNQLGDYTAPQRREDGITVLDGMKHVFEGQATVSYAKGCDVLGTSTEGFDEAIQLARESDVVVLALGGSSARDFQMEFLSNGAVSSKGKNMDCGENVDVANLELGGVQVQLAKKIMETGTKVVTVLIQGRQYSIPWLSENSHAIVSAWYPGQLGGQAIAEVLAGVVNPSGKLPVTVPRSSMQLPIYYNYKYTDAKFDYLDMSGTPLYSFGHGLSYSTFEYESVSVEQKELSMNQLENGEKYGIRVKVKNQSSIDGAEVIQLYIRDEQSTIVRRVKELKGFKKVFIPANEAVEVEFYLGKEELSVWNRDMNFVLEPGSIKLMIGGSSETVLEAQIHMV